MAQPLHPELQKQLEKVRQKRNFQVDEWIDKKTDMLNDYMKKAGLKACVINVSGGVDSAVTVAIALAAMNKKDSPIKRVVGVAQPIHSTEKIWKRALELQGLDPKLEIFTIDQSKVFDLLLKECESASKIKGGFFAQGQLKSYMRTPVAFYIAQLLTQEGTPAIVIGTGNKDEDGYLFYFCKAGDGIADVQLIADLHKSEVFTVGRALNVPKSILEAPPSADLWEGQTDENELGVTYDFVELFTEFSDEEKEKMRKELSEEALKEFDKCAEIAQKIHQRNKHKEKYPYNINVL